MQNYNYILVTLCQHQNARLFILYFAEEGYQEKFISYITSNTRRQAGNLLY